MNIKKILKLTAVSVMIALPSVSSAIWTEYKEIGALQTPVGSQTTFIQPIDNKWGAVGCPNARFIVINSGMAAYKEILANILTSKALGTEVRVNGSCIDANYFSATQFQYK